MIHCSFSSSSGAGRKLAVRPVAAAMRPRLFAWLLVVVFVLVGSCAAPACSSRPLAADGDAAKPLAAAGGGVATAGRGPRGGRRAWNGRRRSMGNRSPWQPPSPVSGGANGMRAPPPPWA